MIKFVTTRVLVCPLPDGIKHLSLNLDTLIPNGWVMKSSDDIIDNFVNRYARVLPCVQDTSRGQLVQGLSLDWGI